MNVTKRLSQLDFTVPGIKMVGLELIKLVNEPTPDMTKIARTAELDPAIFGSIIACANSAHYGGVTEITDIRSAIVRLGLRELRRIIFHVVLESAFRSDNPAVNSFLKKLWIQNLAVALFMQRLLPECPQIKALPMEMVSAMYPLGLMHVMGISVLIANYYGKFAKFVQDDHHLPLPELFVREQEIFDGFDHFQLGSELVRRWSFPPYFCDIIAYYHMPEPKLEPNVLVLHSALRYARHLAEEFGYAVRANSPDGYWLRGLVVDREQVDTTTVAADVAEQLKALMALFG
ncbi:MAG: HDOD domain-containing protein [Desulfovibrionales bacterium]|nr:HDOD domain-containing protein [Desulfovibrionales bacterium]